MTDPRKPFALLRTFGCLAWVNIPKVKLKKLDEPAIPAIFIGYYEEHKGWKFLAPSHNPPIFWSNSERFLQDKLWNDHPNTIPIQDTDTLYYKGMDDIEDLGYNDTNEHDEELQQPIDDIYWPPLKPGTAFEGDILTSRPTDAVFEYLADEIDDAPEPNLLTAPLYRASDGLTDKANRSTMPSGMPLPPNKLDRSIQDSAFSEHLSMQKAQYYHNKFATTHEMFPWLHPTYLLNCSKSTQGCSRLQLRCIGSKRNSGAAAN
ncbi:uncharacterized protein UHOD_12357 [Ustilago sp. UG-2017b]|nr:uncharacterized protein UHOD_12357 [Ustilago sp. UG-2017b]